MEGLHERMARHRVRRGIAWLNRNAPKGWWFLLFYPLEGGGVIFRPKDGYDNECVLALAFQYQGDLANRAGYVTYASVCQHFKMSMRKAKLLGFSEGDKSSDAHVIIESELLNEIWKEELLTRENRPSLGPPRHVAVVKRRQLIVGIARAILSAA